MRSGIHEDAMRVIPRKWRGAGVALRTWASLTAVGQFAEALGSGRAVDSRVRECRGQGLWVWHWAVINIGSDRMNSTDSVPHFIERGDDQNEGLTLPLYVSRQVDDETRRAQEARKRLLAAAMLQQQRIDALNNG